jgi:hypothetical protein
MPGVARLRVSPPVSATVTLPRERGDCESCSVSSTNRPDQHIHRGVVPETGSRMQDFRTSCANEHSPPDDPRRPWSANEHHSLIIRRNPDPDASGSFFEIPTCNADNM